MRTLDPLNSATDFTAQADEIQELHLTICTRAATPPLSLGEKRYLAETTFVSLGVVLEGFISDIFVAHVSQAPASMWSQLAGPSSSRIPAALAGRTSGHISENDIRDVLDSSGWNVGFRDAAALVSKAHTWLVPPRAAKFAALTTRERWVINAVKAIRNHLVHRSRASAKKMNDALASKPGPARLQRTGPRKVGDVGTYLTGPMGPRSRLDEYFDWARTIAGKLP